MPFLMLILVPVGAGAKPIHIWPGDTEEKPIYIWPGNMFGPVITIIRPFAPLLLMSFLVTCRLLSRLLHGRASSLSRPMKTSAAGQSRSADYLAGASLRHHATLQFPNRSSLTPTTRRSARRIPYQPANPQRITLSTRKNAPMSLQPPHLPL